MRTIQECIEKSYALSTMKMIDEGKIIDGIKKIWNWIKKKNNKIKKNKKDQSNNYDNNDDFSISDYNKTDNANKYRKLKFEDILLRELGSNVFKDVVDQSEYENFMKSFKNHKDVRCLLIYDETFKLYAGLIVWNYLNEIDDNTTISFSNIDSGSIYINKIFIFNKYDKSNIDVRAIFYLIKKMKKTSLDGELDILLDKNEYLSHKDSLYKYLGFTDSNFINTKKYKIYKCEIKNIKDTKD